MRATFIATLAAGAGVRRTGRRAIRAGSCLPVVYVFFILCLLGFVPLFTHQGLLSPRALGMVFFVWVSVFNLFVVSVFWSFMADIWSEEQSRRLFPIIAVAGTARRGRGPDADPRAGRRDRRCAAAGGVGIAAGHRGGLLRCCWALGARSRRAPARRVDEAAMGGGMLDGLKQIFTKPFMRSMAVLLLFGDGIGTVYYALVADYSGAHFHRCCGAHAFLRRSRPGGEYR